MLTDLLGGYPVARGIHLASMIGILLFLVVHLTLVVIFPRTLVAMLASIPGRGSAKLTQHEAISPAQSR